MNRLLRMVSVGAATALVVTACGSSGNDDIAEELPDQELPDAEELIDEADALGVSALALALDQTAAATSYRSEYAMGMNISAVALGQTISFPADPAAPMVFTEVDAQGEQHTVLDMAPMMSAIMKSSGLGGDTDASALLGGDLSMESWLSGTTMTIDTDGFGAILTQSPGAAVLPEETFTVDVSQLDANISAGDLAGTLAGQAAPDPVEMAVVLREALGDSADVNGDGTRFSGTMSFLDYSRAFGQEPDAMLGGMDASLDQLGGGDAKEAIADALETITVDVDVALADGAIDTVRFDVDMSAIWDAMPAIIAASGEDLAAADVAEISEMFADATFDMTMLLDFELDSTIDVQVPQGDFPDYTEQFFDLYADAFES